MLILEPVQAAVWHSLNHYNYKDALFLSERLFAEVPSDENLYLLSTCLYRDGQVRRAYDYLKKGDFASSAAKYLYVKCCHDLNKLDEIEQFVSRRNSPSYSSKCLERVAKEFGDSAPFVLQILARLFYVTERTDLSVEAEKLALKLNPLLWKSFEGLCSLGQRFSEEAINSAFSAEKLTDLTPIIGSNSIIKAFNTNNHVVGSGNGVAAGDSCNQNNYQISQEQSSAEEVRLSFLNAMTPNQNAGNTISNFATPAPPKKKESTSNVENTPITYDSIPIPKLVVTPAENNALMESGILQLRSTPAVGGGQGHDESSISWLTPFNARGQPNNQFDTTIETTANTTTGGRSTLPTFGKLRFKQATAAPKTTKKRVGLLGGGGGVSSNVILKLDFSSSSLSILSPHVLEQSSTPNSAAAAEGKQRDCLRPVNESHTANIDTAAKSFVLEDRANQSQSQSSANTGMITPQNTPQQQSAALRRSSRRYSTPHNNPSVKENSSNTPNNNPAASNVKGPVKKSKAVNKSSPFKRGKVRSIFQEESESPSMIAEENSSPSTIAANNQQNDNSVFTENQENKAAKTCSTVTDSVSTVVKIAEVQQEVKEMGLRIQKDSVEGLMVLYRQLAKVYEELCKFNCEKAIDMIEELPSNHVGTSWIQGLVGKARFEMFQFDKARSVFSEIRIKDPNCLDFLEYYSTSLWHLQDDVNQSKLAQDLTASHKMSPQSWIAAGNCYSQLRDHEHAIKFFQRAIQVDPTFPYAFTLLGHEYIMIEELEKALACFRSALKLDVRHYNAWFGIGLTYYKQERFNLADIYYQKARKINGKNPILMCHVAVVQHSLQKSQQALDFLRQTVHDYPENKLCIFELASILFASERYEEALEQLERLKEIAPKEPGVYFLLGKVHNKLKNTHLALTNYSWAMDLDPKGSNSQVKDALEQNPHRVANAEESQQQPQQAAAATNGLVQAGPQMQ